MNKSENQIADDIKKIVEDMESAGLGDIDAWKDTRRKFQEVSGRIPSSMPDLQSVSSLCEEGLTFLARNSAKGFLSLVEAISEGLIASSECLCGDVNGDAFLRKAGRMLEDVLSDLPVRGGDAADVTGSIGGGDTLSINDAAALLIQMEPDDLTEMTRLQELFHALEKHEDYPDSAKEAISDAALRVEALIGSEAPDVEEAMAAIGRLVEKAMNAMVEDEMESPPPDPLPVPEREPLCQTSTGDPEPMALPEDADTDLIAEFVSESADLIEAAEEALLALETDPEDMEAVGTVFRAFHTVKGVSAFLELMTISEMAHHAESLLSRVRDREIRYGGAYADLALRALDMLKHMVQLVHGALEGKPLYKPEGYDDLMELLASPEEAGISDEYGSEEGTPSPRIGDLLVATGKADRKNVEAAAISKSEKPIGVKIMKSSAAKMEDVAQALRTQRSMQGKQVVDSSVRVSTGRLDRLVDMVGELVIAHSMVAQDKVVVDGDNYELSKKVTQTSKIVRELQTLGMSMRMIPLKGTFRKMTRLVRDISRKVGKNVNLVTEGEDTEIDRNMVDIINDPLMHMVRNSVDHGIEPPEERERVGKPRIGMLRLSAYHSAGSVVVEIADDGRGLDRDSILAKAREKGLVGEDTSLTEREIFNLVFEPGFSTAKTVTDVSGRGVGMDVVKKNIESLRGQVEIESEWGKGSIFRMSLPLTLAIIDGMVVRVGNETYIIPTVSIVRSVKPQENELSTVLNRGEMLSLQGHLLPLIQLGRLFHVEGLSGQNDNKLVVVVEDDNKKRAGLVIDDLVGRQQIVIKTLGEGMKNIPGISGGAIMPNGQVGLILDVGGVVKIANSTNSLLISTRTETRKIKRQ
ncbi:MAG: chemotaxis protein CheA [Deltaproteobacteria bacterium]|nr:chemotaxis protein CheA [Deltaproteobacteria bacterium]